jgi:hypothetical protein
MDSTMAQHTPGLLPMAHGNGVFFEDLSTQMAVSQAARRLSRGSNGQRPGSMMRVSKPNSASNSPRSSMAMNRRKTFIHDGYTCRTQQAVPDYLSAVSTPGRSSRPVSWHPSTHLQPYPAQYQQASYPLSTPNMYAENQDTYSSQPQFSPMMAAYSANTSPASAFSPLPLAYQGVNSNQFTSNAWDTNTKTTPYYGTQQTLYEQEQFPAFTSAVHDNAITSTTADWNSFIMHGFNSTSPPTPESFLPAHQMEPTVATSSQVFRDNQEPEEEGEILVGMGLYDTPEKHQEDPHLNNYRSTVSSLLGSKFRPAEPQGKGLKLEETWEPPKSDDEEDSEDADDDDSDE